MSKSSFKNTGFTLVEIMVVIGIIALLVAMVLPNYMRAKHNVNEMLAVKTLNSLASALEMYRIDNDDYPEAINDDVVAGSVNIFLPYMPNRFILEARRTTGKSYRGYHFDYAKTGVSQYTYTATTVEAGSTGTDDFTVDQTGEIKRIPGGPPPASPFIP